MLLSVSPKMVSFTANETKQPKTCKEKVEDAAAVTGGVGAGAAATRGGSALKFFKSAGKVNEMTHSAASAASAIEKPAQQTKSLLNAFRVNYSNFTKQVAEWAEASRMPRFMKGLFTGKIGGALGRGAAVFVFITGIGEVIGTIVSGISKVATKPFSTEN